MKPHLLHGTAWFSDTQKAHNSEVAYKSVTSKLKFSDYFNRTLIHDYFSELKVDNCN